MAPHTRKALGEDLTALGVSAGDILMVHASFREVGWTVGGAVEVVRALLDALGDEGTLVMPAETPQYADPDDWDDPRVQPDWHEAIREHLPGFDPATSPSTMGAIAEAFRTYPGTQRSYHPLVSVCARGPAAETL
ncbi:MAG: AAC(3) family N-acetyltransferase, partial [Myxococcota bacterium]